jgi:hypothetical protein
VSTKIAFDSLSEDFGGEDLDLGVLGEVSNIGQGKYLINFWLTCVDSAVETFIATGQVYQNSATVSPAIYVTNTSGAGGYVTMSGSGIMTLDLDSNSVHLEVTLTGAAGTLTVVGGRMCLMALS